MLFWCIGTKIPGRTVTPVAVKPQNHHEQNFLKKTKFPKIEKGLQRLIYSLPQLLSDLFSEDFEKIRPLTPNAHKR